MCVFIWGYANVWGSSSDDIGAILIDHWIKQTTIAKFVGMNQRTAVTKIMSELINENIIEMKDDLILVKDMMYLEK